MKIREILNLSFPLLTQVSHRWALILFTVFFSIFFLNVFVPFNINSWSRDSGIDEFLRLSGFGIIAGIVLTISQLVIRKWAGVNQFRVWTFAAWFACELLVMAVLFILYQSNGRISLHLILSELTDSVKYTLLGIFIPYSLVLLFIFQIIQKSNLTQLRQKAVKLNAETTLLEFPDEKGIVRFSISSDKILYFESADNYLIIYYLDSGNQKKQILRNSLKNIEALLKNSPMKRCHRSFMVNLQKIELVNYAKAKCQIKLSGADSFIPVSRKFYPEFQSYIRN